LIFAGCVEDETFKINYSLKRLETQSYVSLSHLGDNKKMKICVSATAKNLEAQLDPRFGRCLYLVIVDSGTMQFEAIPNMAAEATGGAGIQAAQTIVNKGVEVVITGNVGPNAFGALSAAGIEIITGASGTVREVVDKFKKSELQRTGAATVGGHFGMGRGRGHGV
jgi:predicted Fe-Mo cluster-binding NifX family protein